MATYKEKMLQANIAGVKMNFFKFVLFIILPARFLLALYYLIEYIIKYAAAPYFVISVLLFILVLGLLLTTFFFLFKFKKKAMLVLILYALSDLALIVLADDISNVVETLVVYCFVAVYFWKRRFLFISSASIAPVQGNLHVPTGVSVSADISEVETNANSVSSPGPVIDEQTPCYCRRCGNILDSDAQFCRHCGTKVVVVESITAEAPVSTTDTVEELSEEDSYEAFLKRYRR